MKSSGRDSIFRSLQFINSPNLINLLRNIKSRYCFCFDLFVCLFLCQPVTMISKTRFAGFLRYLIGRGEDIHLHLVFNLSFPVLLPLLKLQWVNQIGTKIRLSCQTYTVYLPAELHKNLTNGVFPFTMTKWRERITPGGIGLKSGGMCSTECLLPFISFV